MPSPLAKVMVWTSAFERLDVVVPSRSTVAVASPGVARDEPRPVELGPHDRGVRRQVQDGRGAGGGGGARAGGVVPPVAVGGGVGARTGAGQVAVAPGGREPPPRRSRGRWCCR